MISFLTGDRIASNIKEVLSEGGVAVVAYVGKNARNILSKNTIIICNFNSLGTNPHEIAWLVDNNYDVRNLNNLHAKVYCSELGAVVGSSNLSANGLELLEGQQASLIETAVYISPEEKAFQSVYDWCQAQKSAVKKGNIKASTISNRVIEWDKVERNSKFGTERKVQNTFASSYEAFRSNILIVPINGSSDIEDNEDIYRDESGNIFGKHLTKGTAWIEGGAKPKLSNSAVQPIVKELDGKRIVFFYFDTNSKTKKIKSVDFPNSSERGVFKYRSVITVSTKGEPNKFVYLYDRVEKENKEFFDILRTELEQRLIDECPYWLTVKESEANRWLHLNINEILE